VRGDIVNESKQGMGDDKKVSKSSISLSNSPLTSYKKVGNMKLCWHEGLEIMGV
jgi:hypothetical protein